MLDKIVEVKGQIIIWRELFFKKEPRLWMPKDQKRWLSLLFMWIGHITLFNLLIPTS